VLITVAALYSDSSEPVTLVGYRLLYVCYFSLFDILNANFGN
jgi:hypothetical protein